MRTLPSWSVTGPANGEPSDLLIFALASSTSFLTSSVTAGPYGDWTNGLSPVFRPTRKLALYGPPLNLPSSTVCTIFVYSGPQFHCEPVSQPFGAKDDASAWYPTVDLPAASVALMTAPVQSWCWLITSTPCDRRDFAASACLAGSHQLDVLTTYVFAAGFTDLAPSSKALMLSSVCEIGNA